MNSIFPNNTPTVLNWEFDAGFNRQARRKGWFALKNAANGKFIKREMNIKTRKITFSDVELEECSLFRFKHIHQVMNEAPQVDMIPKLIRKINKRITVIDGSKNE